MSDAVPAPPPRRAASDTILGALVAAALVALALLNGDGTGLGAQTWTEIALVVVGAAAAGSMLVLRAPKEPSRAALPAPRHRLGAPLHRVGRGTGATSLTMFAALTVLTAASIGWSVAPDQSWLEAARTLSYLAVFGAGLVAARLLPGRWPALVGGIAVLAVALSACAVIVKVFTLPIDQQSSYGRLLVPFGYWNATGLIAALGLGPVLWFASRRHPSDAGSPRNPSGAGSPRNPSDAGSPRPLSALAARALAVPAVALLITVIVLSYSRSAIAAGVCGLAAAMAGSQVRLRATAALALGGAGAAVVCAWALSDHALTSDRVSAAARSSSGHSFGLVLVVVLVVLGAVAWLLGARLDRTTLPEATRRRVGTVLVGLLALVPVAAAVALAASSRGFTGEISHVWGTLTSTSRTISDNPGRLADLANSRPRYWHQAFSVGEHHLALGAGAGSFGVARNRYPAAELTGGHVVDHAHSYVMQTFSDLGLVGVAISLLLLLAWARDSAAALRLEPAGRGDGGERGAMYALLGAVVAFGVSSAIDWTWFFPGVAVPALVCAGWLAGRGPLRPARAELPPDAGLEQERSRNGASVAGRPLAVLGVTALLALTLAAAWGIWLPLHSADADSAAISALTSLHGGEALADARTAAAAEPFALEPLQELSAIYSALGRPQLALDELVKATTVQPENPLSWKLLGQAALSAHRPRLAVRALTRAEQLDLTDITLAPEIAQAQAAIAQSKR